MKKIISILFILTIVLGIQACRRVGVTTTVEPYYKWNVDPGQWDEQINEYRPETGAKLKLWVDNATWAEALIAEYNKFFPEVPVTYEVVGSVDTRAKMELDGPAGLGADVFVMPHDHIGQALRTNVIGPIGQYEELVKDRIIETSVQTVTATKNNEEKIYAFPIAGESLALFYNKDIIAEKGEEVASTWEEIKSQAAKYNDIDNNFYWIGMDVANAYDMHFIATAHHYELFGPTHKDPDQINFASPEMISALEWHRNFRLEALDVESGSLSGDNIKAVFENGQMAYILDGPWDIQRYKDAGLNFGVIKIPTINVNGEDSQPYTFAGNQLAAISTFTKYPAAARTLANFMANISGSQVMYDVTGKLPTLKDTTAIEGLADDPYLKGIIDQMQFSQPMPTISEMGYYWQFAGGMYGNAWNAPEGITPTQAAQKAEKDYDDARALNQ
ncbi:maltose ABC transporter substrate-binding protein [Mycoplasmatota bacterium]|nr:maltose ABC transporter substrate-binding protein [Mycoplasmatota bacterium]